MANDKKVNEKTETPKAQEPGNATEVRATEALESIALSLGRLADRFAPLMPPRFVPGVLARRVCPQGHAMQPTDDYCQACEKEKRGGKPAA